MGCLEVHDSLDVETDNVSEKLESEEKRAIYIGNLPHSIEEATLSKIFSLSGNIHSIKLVGKSAIKNAANLYAFVEYDDPASAENAIETFNGTLNFIYWGTTYLTHLGRTVFDTPMKVNWAYQSSTSATAREETSSHFTIFVGDLATEVDDETLREAFSAYESLSDARIMWDMTTGRSRGYGFVSFVERSDAEAALEEMPGRWLGSRCIRCNWANQKQTMPTTPIEVLATGPASQKLDVAQQFAIVGLQAHYTVTTIYVGNLAIDTDMSDLKPLFDAYGGAIEIKMHCNRGFAFVRLSSHEWATSAIIQLQGVIVKGRPIKCSWQLRADAQLRQRSKSLGQSTHSAVMVPPVFPVSEYQTRSHLSKQPSQYIIPRSTGLPAHVMTPEQLIALRLLQQQQTLTRINQQMTSMSLR